MAGPAPARSTLGALLRAGRDRLRAAGIDTPRLDAEVLLMHLLGVDRTGLILRAPEPPPPGLAEDFERLLERRAAGEPMAYITGHREFMGLDFLVDPRVLIPRPETEYLVEWALTRARAWGDEPRLIVDVGTGSGAIAVSVAHLLPPRPATQIIGSDRSVAALRVAASNAARLAPGRVRLIAGDLLTWCRGRIDLLLANLPYLRDEQAHPGIAWEPEAALYSGATGFDLYRALLPQARRLLAPDGALICEIDPDQRELALSLAAEHFPGAAIEVRTDLAGLDRYLIVDLAETN